MNLLFYKSMRYFIENIPLFSTLATFLMVVATFWMARTTSNTLGFYKDQSEEVKNKKKEEEKRIMKVCSFHLSKILNDLENVKKAQNPDDVEKRRKLVFTEGSFNEIKGGMFIYYDILLKSIDSIDVSKLSKTMAFFHDYQIQLSNLGAGLSRKDGNPISVRRETYDRLVDELREALEELSK